MWPDTLFAYVRAAPFRPFRVVLNSGRAYEVRHPEMIRVGHDSIVYFHATPPDGPFDRWETLSLALVERVEHADSVTTN